MSRRIDLDAGWNFSLPIVGGAAVITRTMFFWKPLGAWTPDHVWLDWLGVYCGWVRL